MTSVTFSDLQVNDTGDCVTIEELSRHFASFAGVHNFSFDDNINVFDNGDWWAAPSGISYSGDQVIQTASDSGGRQLDYDDPFPHSYSLEFTMHQGKFFLILRNDRNGNFYRLEYDGSIVKATKFTDSIATMFWSKPTNSFENMAYGRVKVAVRDEQFSSDSPGRIIKVGVWLNDRSLFAFADNVEDVIPGLYFAMVAPGGLSNGVVYSDFRVGNLSEVLQWSSLDPGEEPMGAIQRAIEDRYLKIWFRWDGSMRVWIPKARALTKTISSDREYRLVPQVDTRQAFSHVRILGAFQWVQVQDDDLIKMVGHKFRELQNTSLWNADDCQRIGTQMLMRVKEEIYRCEISTVGLPFLEVEDRIELPDPANDGAYLSYIVDSMGYEWEIDTLKLTIGARRYFYA